ncbi:peptidoglycan-binding protein [Parvularcula lutaonensis]|uniref:Peptidoglycan-binding protein n=1 Tax=Parvularcula lutaonensis TaxID=491923 RepID=A0ABV7MDX7_9PROT|nr:peptidoglycan-binding protein [Parvularcula lutaonensis]GGY50186.1 hypothetical protein GCM10007148_18710 [Parvularcula lutaonensis]
MAFLRRRWPEPIRKLRSERAQDRDDGDGLSVSADNAQGQGQAQATSQTISVNTTHGGGSGGSKRPKSPGWLTVLMDLFARFLIVLGFLGAAAMLVAVGFILGFDKGEEEMLERWARFPIGAEAPTSSPALEGGPCRGFEDGICPEARRQKWSIDLSRHYLRRGDAEVAIDEREKARIFFDWAVQTGRPVGADSARLAAKRLQYLNLTCDYDEESLARISRDSEYNVLGGTITTRQRQRALKALSHYTGDVTGRFNASTRRAVERFQNELWFDRTGVLTAEQTVLLVCGAAEIGQDPESQNLLGAMYAVGLGVRQNTDKALTWFNEAARQGSADASWNLALLFGTRTTESSVLVCDADLSPDRADSYLKEAYDAGHPGAVQAVERYGELDPEDRWTRISGDLRTPEALTRVGKGCNPNG